MRVRLERRKQFTLPYLNPNTQNQISDMYMRYVSIPDMINPRKNMG
jgi:hypothetical protein